MRAKTTVHGHGSVASVVMHPQVGIFLCIPEMTDQTQIPDLQPDRRDRRSDRSGRGAELWRASRAGSDNNIQDAGARFAPAGSDERFFR